jgi:hypothetical protein
MQTNNLARIAYPYCLHKATDDSWIVLNRNYKPLGELTAERVDYATHPARIKLKGLTKAVAQRLSYQDLKGEIPERIYLYEDGCDPTVSADKMMGYSDRLAALASLTFTPA